MRQIVAVLIALLVLPACAPVSEVAALRSLNRDNLGSTKFKDVSYSKELRCYVKGNEPLFDELGQKMRSEKDLQNRLGAEYVPWTKGDSALFWGTMIYAVPFSFVTSTVGNILGLPGAPFVYRTYNRLRKGSYSGYMDGRKALDQGQHDEAIKRFVEAEKNGIRLAQDSDIYFHLARAYESSGNQELANLYYTRFLNYSVRQYPDYFQKYDKELKNDSQALSAEFDQAEKKLDVAR